MGYRRFQISCEAASLHDTLGPSHEAPNISLASAIVLTRLAKRHWSLQMFFGLHVVYHLNAFACDKRVVCPHQLIKPADASSTLAAGRHASIALTACDSVRATKTLCILALAMQLTHNC